jgi:hypothetical protein
VWGFGSNCFLNGLVVVAVVVVLHFQACVKNLVGDKCVIVIDVVAAGCLFVNVKPL